MIDWGCIPKGAGLAALVLGVPVCAALGGVVCDRLSKRYAPFASESVLPLILQSYVDELPICGSIAQYSPLLHM